MPTIEHAIIAAAGLGSRLGYGLPKCLVEIGGRMLIERQLELLSGIPDLRIVIGYMENAVIEAVTKFNRNVIFVRNPAYRTTTTQDSYAIGAKGIDGQCLFLDADIVFQRDSLEEFLRCSENEDITIGVTASKTDDAVFAVTRPVDTRSGMEIVSFSRDPSSYEWANIVSAPADTFLRGHGPVFETLQSLLPAPAKEIVSYEVDTEQDLRRAEQFLRSENEGAWPADSTLESVQKARC